MLHGPFFDFPNRAPRNHLTMIRPKHPTLMHLLAPMAMITNADTNRRLRMYLPSPSSCRAVAGLRRTDGRPALAPESRAFPTSKQVSTIYLDNECSPSRESSQSTIEPVSYFIRHYRTYSPRGFGSRTVSRRQTVRRVRAARRAGGM